jgi:hypothetical protein
MSSQQDPAPRSEVRNTLSNKLRSSSPLIIYFLELLRSLKYVIAFMLLTLGQHKMDKKGRSIICIKLYIKYDDLFLIFCNLCKFLQLKKVSDEDNLPLW